MTVYLKSTEKKARTIKNKKIKISKKREDIKFSSVFYVLLGVIIISSLAYGTMANKVVTMGYDIKLMEDALVEEKDFNDELKIEISELKSAKVLESKVVEIGMMEPGDVDYITIGKEVALR